MYLPLLDSVLPAKTAPFCIFPSLSEKSLLQLFHPSMYLVHIANEADALYSYIHPRHKVHVKFAAQSWGIPQKRDNDFCTKWFPPRLVSPRFPSFQKAVVFETLSLVNHVQRWKKTNNASEEQNLKGTSTRHARCRDKLISTGVACRVATPSSCSCCAAAVAR